MSHNYQHTATELNLIQVNINNVKVESTDKCKHESSKNFQNEN